MLSICGSPAIGRGLLAVLAASAAAGALAQPVTIPPSGTIRVPAAVVDSTDNYFPKINLSIKQRPFTPANPSIKPTAGAANSLRQGSMLPTPIGNAPEAKFPGIGATAWIPPDPDIAVGPTHVVQVVNGAVAFFDKTSGAKVFQQPDTPTGFWSGLNATDFIFDPKCFYDPLARRFFIVELELEEAQKISSLLVAVSDDTNPMGTWFKYRINCKIVKDTAEWWLDYPGFGFNKDGVVISGNMFPISGTTADSVFSQIVVLSKAPLLTGASVTATKFENNAFTVQMARTPDTTVNAVYGLSSLSSSSLRVFAVSNSGSAPTLTSADLAVPNQRFYNGAVPTRTNPLDSIGFRMMSAFARGVSVFGAHTMGSSENRAQVSWYEVNVRNWPSGAGFPTLVQSGAVALGNGQHAWMPSIAQNNLGDVVVVYSRSSTSTFPDAVYSARRSTDAPGSMGAPIFFGASLSAHNQFRFGDYSDVEIDPVNGYTFWGVANTFGANQQWTTEIASWNVSVPVDAVTGIAPSSISTVQGTFVSGDLNAVRALDSLNYQVRSQLLANNGQFASVRAKFNTGTTPAKVAGLDFAATASQLQGSQVTGSLFAWNVTTKKWDILRSGSLAGSANSSLAGRVSGTSVKNYVAPDGSVEVLYRSLDPVNRLRGTPAAHTLRVNKLNLLVTLS